MRSKTKLVAAILAVAVMSGWSAAQVSARKIEPARRYNVQHMNHPGNPQPTLYSAYRDYGRFGAFFKKKIASGETLALHYRILVVEGNMPDRRELAGNYSAFVDGPKVEVVSSK